MDETACAAYVTIRFEPQGVQGILVQGRPVTELYEQLDVPQAAYTKDNKFVALPYVEQCLEKLFEGNFSSNPIEMFFDIEKVWSRDDPELIEEITVVIRTEDAAAKRSRSRSKTANFPPGFERLKRSLSSAFLAQDTVTGLFHVCGESAGYRGMAPAITTDTRHLPPLTCKEAALSASL